ncbi:MAG TPA: hypothetical protein DD761_17495, partial [Cyanobacteria bacterium UBA11691]|nr:hypothetical protein [Cyanobacteria bacterium UBA11691]
MKPTATWQLAPEFEPPNWFVQEIAQFTPQLSRCDRLAQILGQRGIQNRETLAHFLSAGQYT